MYDIINIHRGVLCERPVLKTAKNGSKFYAFAVKSNSGNKFSCKVFEDSPSFARMEKLHLTKQDELALSGVYIQQAQMLEGKPSIVSHIKIDHFDIVVHGKKKQEQEEAEPPKSALGDLSAFR